MCVVSTSQEVYQAITRTAWKHGNHVDVVARCCGSEQVVSNFLRVPIKLINWEPGVMRVVISLPVDEGVWAGHRNVVITLP